jgi:type IV secretory pathway TrbF-like protein
MGSAGTTTTRRKLVPAETPAATCACHRGARLRQNSVSRTSAGTSFLRVVVVPALPLAAFLGGAVVLINAQSLLWPLLVGTDRDAATAPVALVRELSRYGQSEVSVGYVTPFAVVIVALLALGALQVGYLDRLAITTDRPRRRATGPPP